MKWFLAIPHYVVLAFLRLAFIAVSVVAFVAILFTGRYPQGLFDFLLGMDRWALRARPGVTRVFTPMPPPRSVASVADEVDYVRQ